VHVDDLEFEEALPLLSVAAEADPDGISRRRFVQGAVAASLGLALPLLRPRDAGAAESAAPLGAGEGVLVSVFLGGGNDGLNMLAPITGTARGHYERLRGGLAVPAGALAPVGDGWGLHPKMAALHRRFTAGQVALVQGTGLPLQDLSHFTAAAKIMQGNVSATSGTGWLGRFLDGLPDASGGLRGMAVGTSVPLSLVGAQSKATTVPPSGDMWGADRATPGQGALLDAVAALADRPTGFGRWGDAIAASGAQAIAHAETAAKAFRPDPGPGGPARDLLLAARLINLDLGARAIAVTIGGWDTHAGQAGVHEVLLQRLDAALEVFFANLRPDLRDRVAVLVQSEFGRRPQASASLGTDHGNVQPMVLIGEHVRGGVVGGAPDLGRLDDRGNPAPSVDFRSVYATVLERWLGADARQVLGQSLPQLDLFEAGPGHTP
jgi:uncharacterized protein (DUF1501 family)